MRISTFGFFRFCLSVLASGSSSGHQKITSMKNRIEYAAKLAKEHVDMCDAEGVNPYANTSDAETAFMNGFLAAIDEMAKLNVCFHGYASAKTIGERMRNWCEMEKILNRFFD